MSLAHCSTQSKYARVARMLNLIVATYAEAEPLIAALKLKKIPALLTCYQNQQTRLVISGMGKCNTATACGWLAEKNAQTRRTPNPSKSDAWLNIGIAGHQQADLGTLMVAHKITDFATKKAWFPHRLFQSILSSDLVTVDKPSAHYLDDQLHDMEASAFVESARHFSHAELVQSLKVVSDNEDQPYSHINAKLATRLIDDNTETIAECIEKLHTMADSITPPDDQISDTILNHWHFSVSQTVQLERLLQRYRTIFPPMTEIPTELNKQGSSKEVLNWLRQTVDMADGYQ